MTDKENEANKYTHALAKRLGIGRNSLCFCASGKKFKRCHCFNSENDLAFLEDELNTLIAYKDSQEGYLGDIPRGIWKKFEQAALNNFTCLYPGCSGKAINSHLIPKNILASNYGGHCAIYKIDDVLKTWQFVKAGIGKDAALSVFCKKHDNDLFKKIDDLNIDFSSSEQLFLIAFKEIGFSFRKTQYLLNLDSHVEMFKPFYIQKTQNLPPGSNVTIDLSYFHGQYIRYIAVNEFWQKSVSALEKKDWNFFSHFNRSISYTKPLFFAAFLNPSHDLNGQKINTTGKAIAMTCTIFTKDGFLNVVMSCPDKTSTGAYQKFFQQLASVDDEVFITVINNILTMSAEEIILSENFSLTQDELDKINNARTLPAQALISPDIIFDLKNSDQAVKFITLI